MPILIWALYFTNIWHHRQSECHRYKKSLARSISLNVHLYYPLDTIGHSLWEFPYLVYPPLPSLLLYQASSHSWPTVDKESSRGGGGGHIFQTWSLQPQTTEMIHIQAPLAEALVLRWHPHEGLFKAQHRGHGQLTILL